MIASILNISAPDICGCWRAPSITRYSLPRRSEEHTSELQSHSDLHSFPTRRSSDLLETLVADDRLDLEHLGAGHLRLLACALHHALLASPRPTGAGRGAGRPDGGVGWWYS